MKYEMINYLNLDEYDRRKLYEALQIAHQKYSEDYDPMDDYDPYTNGPELGNVDGDILNNIIRTLFPKYIKIQKEDIGKIIYEGDRVYVCIDTYEKDDYIERFDHQPFKNEEIHLGESFIDAMLLCKQEHGWKIRINNCKSEKVIKEFKCIYRKNCLGDLEENTRKD